MYKQAQIFEYMYPRFKINKKVRLIELFAGIGSQAKSLKRLGVDFETYKVIEFDKHCIDSYNAIHGTNFETKDITKVSANELEITEREREIHIHNDLFIPLPRFKFSWKR